MCFSPDGKQLASGGADRTVRLWDVETGACVRTLEGHRGGVMSACFSPDGRRLASGSCDDTVRLWDAETGACVRTLEGHGNVVWSVRFSPDGRRLASGSEDKTVRLWDVETGACVRTLEGPGGPEGHVGLRPVYSVKCVFSVCFSPDEIVASGDADRTVRLWLLV